MESYQSPYSCAQRTVERSVAPRGECPLDVHATVERARGKHSDEKTGLTETFAGSPWLLNRGSSRQSGGHPCGAFASSPAARTPSLAALAAVWSAIREEFRRPRPER